MQTKFYSFLLVLLVSCGLQVFADEPTYVLSGEVKRAHSAGIVFQPYNLFTETTGDKHNVLSNETLLLPNTAAITTLFDAYPKAVSLQFKHHDGKVYTIELLRSTPLAFEQDFGYIDENGRHKYEVGKTVNYQGAVVGFDQSFAAISVFANGEVMGMFGCKEGNFVIGKLDDNSGKYIFYNDHDFTSRPKSAYCSVDDYAVDTRIPTGNGTGNKTTTAYHCHKVSIYWEADYAVYKQKSFNVTNVTNYFVGLFNQVQAIYRNENLAVELKSGSVWTTNDPYDSSTSGKGLNTFQAAWNAKGDTFNANLAMLLAKDPGGNGGVAYVDVLCYRSSSYAYGDVDVSYATVPTYSWDVDMVTHEHGHNFGSKHTHWCGWMTGPGSTCGSIDDCTTKESSAGCSSCTYEQYANSLPVTAWKGSIMSYCHLVSRGKDLSLGFGPLPGNVIRTQVDARPCLSSVISASFTVKPICKGDGAITMKFDTNTIGSSHFGPAPYRYVWSHGPTTPNVSGLKTPNTYSLEITDSTGCKEKFFINVPADASEGCWPASVYNAQTNDGYISVYPNPATQQVSLKYYAQGNAAIEMRITDMTGKDVMIKQLNSVSGENNTVVNIGMLAKGVYFLKLNTGDAQYKTVKLVVE